MVKEILKDLDKAFENRIRLGIMSALVVNDYLDFNALKELLEVTDGNLASHLKALEKSEYITYKKEFLDRKPNTNYSATDKGKEAFKKHINAIEQLLK
ncbi:Winged helix DNA-binding domain-containing protein [Thermoflexibacter ruber]|uniref:Winged helix DNA-binding domain-containing protein n=1 Tax=Thermoflexibacter ruber TaxID=1003 RepID=A0A1I2HTP5_9BACT|nr:Winged helix DNA-binding domain-containing protein [Thermoflexibacter ruber]